MKRKRVTLLVVAVLFAGSMGLVGAMAGGSGLEPSPWVVLITSKDDPEQGQAYRIASAQRQVDIQALLEIVRSPLGEREEFYTLGTPRNLAIRILGEMRAAEAVPDLMLWLEAREGQGRVTDQMWGYSHAGEALMKIGLPAVPALMEKLKAKGISPVRGDDLQCLKMLVRIKGADEMELALGKAIEAETDPVKKANLEAALAKLRDPEFPAADTL